MSPDNRYATLMRAVKAVFFPLTNALRALGADVRNYRLGMLRSDLLAGLTVAMVAVPQSMAFANIAGVPEVYGLYTAIVGAIVGSLFTSSRYLAPGPTNTAAILTAGTIGVAASFAGLEPIQIAIMLALLVGVTQLVFAFGRLGDLVRYVSRSVIVGFSAGAGVLIAVKQIAPFLGMHIAESEKSSMHGVLAVVDELIHTHSAVHWQTIAVGIVSLAVVLISRRVSKWLPGYLLAIVVGGLIVILMGWTHGEVALVGELPEGLPPLVMPAIHTDALRALLAPALAVALVGMIEVVSISKTLAPRSGDRIDANREFLNIGATNVVGAFFQGIPSSGSFSRSALNADSGAVSRFACLLGGLLIGGIFLLLAPVARYIPMASIAALLFVIAYGLIDFAYFRRLIKSNQADLLVCLGTFVATLTIPLEWAVLAGVVFNIALYLRRARQVLMVEMVPRGDGFEGVDENPREAEARTDRDIALFQIEGNLFFASADELQDKFLELLQSPAKAVILRLKRTHLVDATVMYTLEQFVLQMHERDRHVLLCGVRSRMRQRMKQFGLIDIVGEDNVFETADNLFGSTKAAVARAHELARGDQPEPDRAPPSAPPHPPTEPTEPSHDFQI